MVKTARQMKIRISINLFNSKGNDAYTNVSASALDELRKIPIHDWPKLHCDLNSWRMPKQLEHIKPDWWPDEPSGRESIDKMIAFIRPLMNEIVSTVGDKACNREWNRDRMTDEEHERFWAKKMRWN